MKRIPIRLFGLFLAMVIALPVHAEVSNSVPSSVLANGGVPIEDNQYRMVGTVGQPMIGVISSSSHLHYAGFWPVVEEVAPSEEVLPGDMDGDGSIGIRDFFIFAAAFGCSREDACYDPLADLDGDDSVGISDFFIFASHFGEEQRAKLAASAWELLGIPLSPRLHQNHPNPFNPITTIAYDLPKGSDVTVAIYTITGQKVAELTDGHQEAGHHSVPFDGSGLANGVYLYRLEAGSFAETRSMVLLR